MLSTAPSRPHLTQTAISERYSSTLERAVYFAKIVMAVTAYRFRFQEINYVNVTEASFAGHDFHQLPP
jgi:hypothetical protein